MNSVTIQYKPFGFLPFNRNFKGEVPSSWDEISPGQLTAMALAQTGKITEMKFLSAFTGIRSAILRKLSPYHIYSIVSLLEWKSNSSTHNAFIIPYVTVYGVQYFTPRPKLKGMTFSQFIFADSLFSDYQAAPSPALLSRFIAALCLPRGASFSDSIVEANAPAMETLPPEIGESLLINYQLIINWLQQAYPLFFLPSDDSNGKKAKTENRSLMWIKIFENMVGDDVARSGKYAKLPVHTVLRWLSRKIRENAKLEHKYRNL